MKTSKIIFIAILSTIALLIVLSFLDIRIRGHRNSDFLADHKVNKQTIPLFKVLYLNNSMNVELVQNDSSYLRITSMKDSVTPQINYTIKEDTMRLTDLGKKSQSGAWVSIHVANTLDNIQLKNSGITITKFSSKKLSLDLDKSSAHFNSNNNTKSGIGILNIQAKNHSHISTSRFNVDSLGVVLRNSEANLEVKALKLIGTLSDSSRIYARQPDEIWLKRDASSKVNVNDY